MNIKKALAFVLAAVFMTGHAAVNASDGIRGFGIEASSPAAGSSGVYVDKEINIFLSSEIETSTAGNIVITAGGTVVSSGLYTVTADGSNINIKFQNAMEYSTAYSIDLSGVEDIYGQTIEDGFAAVEFTTEDQPPVRVIDIKMYKGIDAGLEQVSGITADNTLSNIVATVKNNTGQEQEITIICAIYNANERLIGCLYMQKRIGANLTCEIGNGIKISEMQSGGIIKVYSWNSAGTMRPWENVITKFIE